MSPMQQMFLGLGAVATKTYVDDIFSTFLRKSTGATATVVNGIDLSGEGGLVWTKSRSNTFQHVINDSIRGANHILASNTDTGSVSGYAGSNTFTSTGYSIAGGDATNNASGYTYVDWSFRKAPGFFDVVSWTGNNASNRAISHSLGSVPGLILVKATSTTKEWQVWHRDQHGKVGVLDTTAAFFSNASRFPTTPTSTNFYIGNDSALNANSTDYVAYVFAGGESTAATARSVDFDGSGDYLVTNTSSDYDFGTGDFTVEHWIRPDSFTTAQIIDARATGDTSGNWCTYITTDNTYRFNKGGDQITSTTKLSIDEWTHCAVVRNSGTTTLYINGIPQGTYNDTNDYDDDRIVMGIHGPNLSSFPFNGQLSNVRVVKGTAVYTSAFRVPTEPLTSITNTKLLCCNNSSITGTTTGTVTSGGNPTASTDSPFDDATGFVFGENEDQGVIKCGSYVGNGSATHRKIELGFEPQWIMTKRISGTGNWDIADMMRGTPADDGNASQNGSFLWANQNWAEATDRPFTTHSTGFGLKNTSSGTNGDGDTYIYMAIRRSDGYVGKPPELGTGVFAMDTGAGSSTIPNFDSGFPVDFGLIRKPATAQDWWTYGRLIQGKYLLTNTTAAEGADGGGQFDSNTGFYEGSGIDSTYQSWMWKRGAGFDVVTATGTGVARQIPHSLNKPVEMIWSKKRSGSDNWVAGHKGLDGGTAPWTHYLSLNLNIAEGDDAGAWNDTAPTSTHFSVGTWNEVNDNGENFIYLLFASVDGISKVGSYTGNGTGQTITTGFQPRFLLIKNYTYTGGENWRILDTTRGWGSGNDCQIRLSSSIAQSCNEDWGAPTSTGFTLTASGDTAYNKNGNGYIYYCHA